MKEIKLTQGKVAIVDDEDYDRLNQYKWHTHRRGRYFYATRKSPAVEGVRKIIYMHHDILENPSGKYVVDHKNGNCLDNTKGNLRIVSRRQNMQNSHVPKTSKYPGVHWSKRDKRWIAQIKAKGINRSLGYYKTEEEAFEAYKKAVKKCGETVITN